MKKIFILSLILIGLPVTVACNSFSTTDIASSELATPLVNSAGIKDLEAANNSDKTLANNTTAVVNGMLSEQEISDLVYMREEEKLARDVYLYLYEQWGLAVFQNIAASEQTHTNSVLSLLNLYGIADPAAGLEIGQFQDANLQELYNQLTVQGSTSLINAIKVGAAIEEIDILDLQEAGTHTNQPDILFVYENLTQGSYNHLHAFVNSLRNQSGETYQAQYLSAEEYQSIINGSMGNGMGNNSQSQPGSRGRRTPNRN